MTNRRHGQRIEFAELLEFAVGHLDDAEEASLFALEATDVLGVVGDPVGSEGIGEGDAAVGQTGVIDLADLFKAGFDFEGLQTRDAEQAPLGVDDALDDASFNAVGGSDGALVFGGHFGVSRGAFACEQGETGAGGEVDGGGLGGVFESDAAAPGLGGVFRCVLAVAGGAASRFFLGGELVGHGNSRRRKEKRPDGIGGPNFRGWGGAGKREEVSWNDRDGVYFVRS